MEEHCAENMKSLYDVDMSADAVEKRWTSLRDMFSRECRRQKLTSESGYEPKKEWQFYKTMLFLLPHVTHRRTTTSLALPNYTSSCSSPPVEGSIVPLLEDQPSEALRSSNVQTDHDYYTLSHCKSEEMVLTTKTFDYSTSSSSSSSSSSSNFKSSATPSIPLLKSREKIMPDSDAFAKRRKNNDGAIAKELAEATSTISQAVSSVSSLISSNQKENRDGYMLAIKEGLSSVPARNKTGCLIEVLQVIQKYQENHCKVYF